MMPFPDSDECLSALLDAFARASEHGPMAVDSQANAHAHANGYAPKPAAFGMAPASQQPRWSSPEQEAHEHARTALDGVDFLTRMQVSAALSGRSFLACCKALGMDPRSLAVAQRRAIDDQMAAHFRQTADAGGITRPETAAALLHRLLAGQNGTPVA
jgi:hypothetical protein